MASKGNKFVQKHYPPGSGGCVRDVQFDASGNASIKRTSGGFATMPDNIQDLIKDAKKNGKKQVIYEFRGSEYYIDLDGESDSDHKDDDDDKAKAKAKAKKKKDDDEKKEIEDFFGPDLEKLSDGTKGLHFVGNGASQKIDIQFDAKRPLNSMKADFAAVMSCDPDEIGFLGVDKNGDIVEMKYKTPEENGVASMNDMIVYKKGERKKAVIKIIRQAKWKDEKFVAQAYHWLKDSGNMGQAGVNKFITENGCKAGWQDLLSKRNYTDMLTIIKNENFKVEVDKLRTDAAERKKWGITDEEVKFIDFTEYHKMVSKAHDIREKFYADMSQIALKGVQMSIDSDSLQILKQFPPNFKPPQSGQKLSFFGIISLIDAKLLKAMGVVCDGIDEIKNGRIYMYPGFDHDKTLQWKGKRGRQNVGTFSGGHGILCEVAGIPPEFCAGFAILPPTLKFRSGTCNWIKQGKIKGFDNGRALNDILQDCLKRAFNGTVVEKYYQKFDTRA